MTTLRGKLALTIMATGAAIGASLLASPDADASPLGYIQALNARGITVYDTDSMFRTGYAVCTLLNSYNGNEVVEAVYLHFVDVTSIDMAGAIVVSAVEQLCPWHDHRGAAA